MRIPDGLASLAEHGVITDVVRPLMSGKEAQVFIVTCNGKERIAKVYKEATARAFKHRGEYTEGRRGRNTRDQRAMAKRTRHGRETDESAWQATEVQVIRRLRDAGVRVPVPLQFMDGVLLMEMVADEKGEPAPRLGDVDISPEAAKELHRVLVGEVVRMLCAGIVHGDLSDFNVLVSADGPVIIDFPQAVDASTNPNAKTFLLRDVANLDRFLARFVPDGERPRFLGEEIWDLHERGELTPQAQLTGRFRPSRHRANTGQVLDLIEHAEQDELWRRSRLPPPEPTGGGGGKRRGGKRKG